ncbi:MAG: hypothetical protein U0269_33630 [Polyangiales bacterium]
MDIEDRLERIEKKLDQLLAKMAGASAGGASARGATPSASAGDKEIASDADLDSPRGNPEVRTVPKRWTGEDMRGRKYSDCEPEFLDMLADMLDWFANKDDESGAVDKNGNPKSKWGRLDATRARGWARRIRADRGESPRASGGGSRSAGPSSASRGAPSNGGGFKSRPARPADDMIDPMDGDDGESIPF